MTICAHQRLCLFGETSSDGVALNAWGQIAQACWEAIPAHFPNVELDAFVVMPNHMHGIIVITEDASPGGGDVVSGNAVGGDGVFSGRGMTCHAPTIAHTSIVGEAPIREFSRPIARSLAAIIGSFKSAVTRQIRQTADAPDHPVWQRNYYEHIIRNQDTLTQIRNYIANNPARWADDQLYSKET